ncbi:hypothetical protein [Nocardiopsis halotolerans]|uniref:hypothetical protein n=1 Tax=Nocardiopsis halotolerans TaxID=124252 RepID=UPI0003453690|nr:hypothetical protein [Nocardiopsis halotolerans]
MEHPIGRHRRPRQSLAGRVWALTATILAIALAHVFVPQHPRRERAAITPPPRRPELPPTPAPTSANRHPAPRAPRRERDDRTRTPHARPRTEVSAPRSEPDRDAGALVRPYMPPHPRVPVGDLLAASPAPPVPEQADDMGDLTAAIRLYLDRLGDPRDRHRHPYPRPRPRPGARRHGELTGV